MPAWSGWLVAAVSIGLCLFLWFRDVRRIMQQRQSTVESAARQYMLYSRKIGEAHGSAEAMEVLDRSENIYRQAIGAYNRTLRKIWIRLPAILMGFHFIDIG